MTVLTVIVDKFTFVFASQQLHFDREVKRSDKAWLEFTRGSPASESISH